MEDLPAGLAGAIHAVCVDLHSRKDDAGVRTLEPSVRTAGADYDGSGINISDEYAYHNMYAWEVNPDTAAAWTAAQFAAMEAGYHLDA